MKIIERAVTKDGTPIQLEDWKEHNTKEYPNLHGFTIGAYPIAQRTSESALLQGGKSFRLTIAMNSYADYTNENVLADYESLKNGTKTLADLREHFWNRKKDEYVLGL